VDKGLAPGDRIALRDPSLKEATPSSGASGPPLSGRP
jgi:hypothetical protein